jgi:hypothetical protein
MTEERTVNCLRQMEHIGGLGWLLFAFLEKPQYGIWANKGTSRRAEEHSLNYDDRRGCVYIITSIFQCMSYIIFFMISVNFM